MKPKIKDIENRLKNLEINDAIVRLKEIEAQYGLSLGKLLEKYLKKKEALTKEQDRYDKMTQYETQGYEKGYNIIAGLDEAGRGPLAGPVVASAVILPQGLFIPRLNDSKKLSAKVRDEIFDIIKEKAVSYGIGIVDEKCIDEINILNATKRAMEIAVTNLKSKPDLLLLDSIQLENIEIDQISIVKGDSLSVSIAAASILAKVTRDRLIDEMDNLYPEYGFKSHKGYGTKEHIDAIKKYGICPIHRISFTKNFTSTF